MLTKLREVIEELEIEPRSDDISEGFALRSLLDAKLSAAVADFDANGLWELDYAPSMVAWLRTHGQLSARDAGRVASVAKRLRSLPVTRVAWEHGALSGGQVQAIVANVARRHVELFASHEDALIPYLVELSVAETAAAMADWASKARDNDPIPPAPPERALHFSGMLDGRFRLDGDFDAEGGSLIGTALRLAESPDSIAEAPRVPSQRRGDALVDICRFFLDYQHTQRGGRHRPHLNVMVDLDEAVSGGGGAVIDGPLLDGPTIQRLLCDAGIHRCVTAGRSTILDYGATTRTIPAPLWNALVLRDVRCRFPHCDRPAYWCLRRPPLRSDSSALRARGHHVIEFPKGTTKLANLVLLCSRHHHLIHTQRWELKLLDDGELHLTSHLGHYWVTRPPP